MNKNKAQEQRLNYLLEEFRADCDEYKHIEIPESEGEKKRLLRSLMNIRMPRTMAPEVIKVQDEYLYFCAKEKGIVKLSDIPLIKDNLSIWQGDITRLEVDAIVNAANSMMLGCFVPMHTCIDNQIHTFAGIQLREECNCQMEKLRKKYGRDYEQPTAGKKGNSYSRSDSILRAYRKFRKRFGRLLYQYLRAVLGKWIKKCGILLHIHRSISFPE